MSPIGNLKDPQTIVHESVYESVGTHIQFKIQTKSDTIHNEASYNIRTTY